MMAQDVNSSLTSLLGVSILHDKYLIDGALDPIFTIRTLHSLVVLTQFMLPLPAST